MADEVARLDAHDQAALVRAGQLTPRQLIDAAIARIERLNPRLGAVILPAFDRARQAADALATDPAAAQRPFAGVPTLMKDLGGNEAGTPHHMGMAFLKTAGWAETEDSHIAAQLRRAGFISLGRTNTPELGLTPTTEPAAYGATHNPWNLDFSAGGSSGGAAAAVAAGLVPVAHASDGGGSIRIPAAHCGLVGLKPTRGRNSFGPSTGERWGGCATQLVVSRSVRDTAAVLDATAGAMPGDPYVAPPPARPYVADVGAAPGRLRIGFTSTSPRTDITVDPDCTAAAEQTARLLRDLGHDVEPAYPTGLGDPEALRTFVTIVSSSVARALDAAGEKVGRPAGPSDVEPLTWALAEIGQGCSAARYLAAVEFMHRFGREMAAWWTGGFDLLLTPTTAQPPPRLGALASPPDAPLEGFLRAAPYGAFTAVFNMTGQPAISLPLHWTADGLPVGVQLVAAFGREDLLVRVAAQLEQARPWKDRRPPTFA